MDGVDGGPRRRRTLKERLRFTGMGCCGATWVFRPATLNVRNDQDEQEGRTHSQQMQETNTGAQDPNPNGPECLGPTPSGSGMNLAAALAAERQLRGAQEPDGGGEGSAGETRTAPGTPWRVSLMKLLEETEGGDAEVAVTETEREGGEGAVGNDSVCCVCMGRKKGAAFIPCGHTYCRVCSRELWLNRGSCPLCNRSILDILDIF
ncbi:uncharacterized protein LOC133286448 isoform X2 [Gastrolobium bilobum]|nr:uncharacterized protein LOC133286448 isoform X2 [Gastrolobium bilobum]